MDEQPQVSWKAIERDARVVSSDGHEVGKVSEVAGDPNADIFDGLVLSLGTLDHDRYLPAERVRAIWPNRVEVAATAAEIRALSHYEEPRAERWMPGDGIRARIRRFFAGR